MAFYIKPPKGVISQRKLHLYAEKRLKFLIDLYRCKDDEDSLLRLIENISTVNQSECLIDGTVSDRISHFILRLVFYEHSSKIDWFLDAECILFKLRLERQSRSDAIRFLNQTEFHVKEIIKSPKLSTSHFEVLQTLQSVCKLMKKKVVPSIIKVPFQHALEYVQQREFPLEKGKILFPIERIDDLLLSLHRLTLFEGLCHMRNLSMIISDVRIKDIEKYLTQFIYDEIYEENTNHLKACEVENVSYFFPPCMSHLYNILRTHHRLQHHSRIQLTLFLKDIGLPINEALLFWEKEYSMPVTESSRCSHSWSKESQRYIYNIRHLYGQEGSNKTYKSHLCKTLQEDILKPIDVGGCPFAQHDVNNINKIMQENNIQEPYINNILEYNQQKRYSDACLQHFMAQYTLMKQRNDVYLSSFNYVAKNSKDRNEDFQVNINDNEIKCKEMHKMNCNCSVSKIEISKPADYFKSFQMLLNGLKNSK
ncbi:DNA primase large subunit-like [Centruroides vittatus]|uniref:DNA primase large subunit-like n=1 Tax=Centruroides vittatus TaxID=120091 RepID=UPI00350EF3CF